MSKVLVRYIQYFFNVKDIHWLKGILTIKIKLPWSYIFCNFFKAGNKYTVEALLTITYCHLHKTSVFSTPISTNSVFLHSHKVSDKHQLWTQPFSCAEGVHSRELPLFVIDIADLDVFNWLSKSTTRFLLSSRCWEFDSKHKRSSSIWWCKILTVI